jgi:Rod binding domain-containing protein
MDGITPISDFGFQTADCGTDLNPQSAIVSPQSNPAPRDEEKKKQVARDFESVLLTRVFDQVRESIGQCGLDEDEDDGTSQQVHGLFWLYLAQDVANKGGVGLWREIYQHLGDIEKAPAAGELIDREL